MPRRLPPLNALPSFEAAARHLSFSRAADELHVTHGAVSRAVRNLEDQLGVQLMIRATRSARLTPIGASYAAEIRDVLERLAAATSAATGQSSGILSVSTIDSFAARWLMPRLSRFRQAHGDIDVRVAMSERLADFINDGIDIAIRCGGGQYPGLSAALLMEEDHFPVCSPKLPAASIRCAPPPISLATRSYMTFLLSIGPYGCTAPGSIMSTRTAVQRFYRPITRSKLQSGERESCSAAAPWSPTTLPPAGWCGRSS
jgi:DNA-binding transcriptional LysR family regulator